jgi:phosphate transport system substrate-binding protein
MARTRSTPSQTSYEECGQAGRGPRLIAGRSLRKLSLLLLLVYEPARATTNLAPAISLLLNDKQAYELTAGLTEYQNPPSFAGKFTCVGGGISTMLVNRWAADFAARYSDVEQEIHGGGSVNGLTGLVEGKVDLVPMNRPLAADELARFKAKYGYEPAQIVVAQDAEGIYVNKNNPLPGLTLAQLDAIYSRDAKRGGGRPEFWRELGVVGPLAGERINRVSLSSAHSSYRFFEDTIMQGADYRLSVRFEAVPTSLVQDIGADDTAIGFASVMFATARTRLVPLQSADGRYLLPSYENTLNGAYPLVHQVRIVFHRKSDGSMNRAAREFLRFAVSRRGQRIIAVAGSYPLTPEQQSQALQTIGEAP